MRCAGVLVTQHVWFVGDVARGKIIFNSVMQRVWFVGDVARGKIFFNSVTQRVWFVGDVARGKIFFNSYLPTDVGPIQTIFPVDFFSSQNKVPAEHEL